MRWLHRVSGPKYSLDTSAARGRGRFLVPPSPLPPPDLFEWDVGVKDYTWTAPIPKSRVS